ncbi:unnamed protein product [Adineta steineri]|uniref:Uncharacterized protein n=1 Tax=Adineta steineri TaxID=433720 RepID=A0A815CLI5_9BILA|nr:unnamed protein product [Adineta steineri]
MKDLSFFVCFISIFLIGYSVTSYSLITTEQQVNWYQTSGSSASTTYTLANDGSGLWNWTIIRNVIDWGMWKVYGQVELLDHQQVDDTTLSGQYLGIRFLPEAGSPFSTERNQYYCYFDGETDPETPLQFTRCWTKGIAMSFHVQPTQGSSK